MRDIEKYEKDYNVPNFEDYQLVYRRRKILESLEKYKPKTILEIGCGMEPLFQFWVSSYDTYTVIEPGEKFYKHALECARYNDKIRCVNDFFGEKSVKNLDCYDVIICSGLLHEVEEITSFLESIRKVCHSDTIVHFNVPNAKSFHRLLAKEMGIIKEVYEPSQRNILYQQNRVFDLETLLNLLQEYHFSCIESGSYFVKPFTHDQMFQMLENGCIDKTVLDGLWKMTEYMPELGSEIYANCKIE